MDETQLHAYVDDRLTPAERSAVDAFLAIDQAAAARVRAWRAQVDGLHQLFDPVLGEQHRLALDPVSLDARDDAPAAPLRATANPSATAADVPAGRVIAIERMATARPAIERAPPPARSWRMIGGWAAALCLGFALGYGAHFARTDAAFNASSALARQAVVTHVAYAPEVRHPVEVAASDEQHLVTWLTKRLGVPVRPPVFSSLGFHLLGGRLLPPAGEAGSAPVAHFMYEDDQKRRLSLLIRRETGTEKSAAAPNAEIAFKFTQVGKTQAFYWIEGAAGYALAGDLPYDELARLARLAGGQIIP